ncbi:hypothetical protein NE237_028412 [Protea cynaroides]|uniref:Uncharacterized protein n=1 Tax=Protea cynaroides TaxID=273540 RepID=A0A9Q0GSC0_9MAGN|nr:hypothetical protein NE237_028412 [Protea cynaroides]
MMRMEESEEKQEIEREDSTEEQLEEAGEEWKRVPPWTKQITVRGVIASLLIGSLYSIILMKLVLTTGVVPNLNVSAALLAFVLIRGWTKVLQKFGFVTPPFTRQENTVIQTCTVACYSIAMAGGFGSYLLGLYKNTYQLAGVNTEGNTSGNYKEPQVGWMTGYLLASTFVGILALSPLRKILLRFRHDLRWSRNDLFPSCEFVFTPGGCAFLGHNYEESEWLQEYKNQSSDDRQKNELFMRESIPIWLAYAGYLFFSIVSIIVIPKMFPQLKWYFVLVAYVVAPSLCFCNAYGTGLTDMNMSINYGKVALFVIASIVGKDSGVVAALVGCGVVKSVVHTSADLMHDFKTGHLTLTSPRSMVLSQLVGTAIGCILGPLSFFLYYKTFDVGNPNGEFKAPFALIYRNMAILGVQGFSALPQHCLQLCYGFFAFAVGASMVRDLSPPKIGKWMPLPMAMAVPFIVGANFAIDMCVGSLIVYVWHKVNKKKASMMVTAVASGLICGDGLWILPSSILALAKVNPPICMTFLPFRK